MSYGFAGLFERSNKVQTKASEEQNRKLIIRIIVCINSAFELAVYKLIMQK